MQIQTGFSSSFIGAGTKLSWANPFSQEGIFNELMNSHQLRRIGKASEPLFMGRWIPLLFKFQVPKAGGTVLQEVRVLGRGRNPS